MLRVAEESSSALNSPQSVTDSEQALRNLSNLQESAERGFEGDNDNLCLSSDGGYVPAATVSSSLVDHSTNPGVEVTTGTMRKRDSLFLGSQHCDDVFHLKQDMPTFNKFNSNLQKNLQLSLKKRDRVLPTM